MKCYVWKPQNNGCTQGLCYRQLSYLLLFCLTARIPSSTRWGHEPFHSALGCPRLPFMTALLPEDRNNSHGIKYRPLLIQPLPISWWCCDFHCFLSISSVSAQWCPILCNPLDRCPPGSSVHGILQARILEWIAMPSSRGFSQPRDRTQVYCIAGGFFTIRATREAQYLFNFSLKPQ